MAAHRINGVDMLRQLAGLVSSRRGSERVTVPVRMYRKTYSRTPKKIFMPDGKVMLGRTGEEMVTDKVEFIQEMIRPKNDKATKTEFSIDMQKYTLKKNQEKLILLEGKRLIEDGLAAGVNLEVLYKSSEANIDDLRIPASAEVKQVPYKHMQQWSDLMTSPGIMGVFKMPSANKLKYAVPLVPLTVICDNVREPGNLGSILRSAAGVGCERVLLTKGCVDVWDRKVLRSGSGAHFRVPITKSLIWENMPTMVEQTSAVFVADNRNSQADSGLELVPYSAVEYAASKSYIVIVGGETEGLSSSAKEFAKRYGGKRVQIPLQAGIDSLNVGTALGVILFEIRRQWMCKASN